MNVESVISSSIGLLSLWLFGRWPWVFGLWSLWLLLLRTKTKGQDHLSDLNVEYLSDDQHSGDL